MSSNEEKIAEKPTEERAPEEKNVLVDKMPLAPPLKSQVLPVVYFQAPIKNACDNANINASTTANLLMPQLQFAANKSVILTPVPKLAAGKPTHQQIVITKPVSNNTAGFLTMIKPITNPQPHSDDTTNTTQKIVIAPVASKLLKNHHRLPVTVTTTNPPPLVAKKPKITFLPLSSTTAAALSTTPKEGPAVFNFKIEDDGKKKQSDELKENKFCPSELFERKDLTVTTTTQHTTTSQSTTPKYNIKHGISILKKNYQNDVNKQRLTAVVTSTPIANSNPNLIADNSENIEKNNNKTQKTERRRKSNFSYRKDYDDMEIVEEQQQEEKISSAPSIDASECDPRKILKWEEGIGTLPGSNLKFIMNEFGMLEYIAKDDLNKLLEKKLMKKEINSKNKNELEDLRCIECGCYGLPSEFITIEYCSLDCKVRGKSKDILLNGGDMKMKRKKRKRPALTTASNNANNILMNTKEDGATNNNNNMPPMKIDPMTNNSSEDDNQCDNNSSNENSQDKNSMYLYPWLCSKKGFSWTKYLEHIKAKAAPVKLFKDPFPYNRNLFRAGMKLEGIDPQHPSYFCVLTVVEVIGYRMRLNFDGYSAIYDFWVNADSVDIFPVGWCEKHNRQLLPPPGYTVATFNWTNYLKVTKGTAAPKHLFQNRVSSNVCPNGFRVGMKLEAVDRKNLALVCVATVKDMMDNRILVHFDSWDDIYDYWVDPTSPYIHPVGWCDQTGHNLTPPNDYPNPSTFSWEKYLKETKSSAAPVRAFKQRAPAAFKIGMRLECVDKRMPRLVRVAHVSDIRAHQICVHFDGWREIYSYWIDDDSSDLHPIGWCQKTGHPLEQPLTPDDVYDTEDCPTAGCKGFGHANGLKTGRHLNLVDCPYSEDNLVELNLPDRLLSPDRRIEAVVPVSIEPKDKVKPKIVKKCTKNNESNNSVSNNENEEEVESMEEPAAKKQKRKYKKRLKLDDEMQEPKEEEEEEEEDEEEEKPKLINENISSELKKVVEMIEKSKIEPAKKESWPRHSRFLRKYLLGISEPVELWDDDRVVDFVKSIPGCAPNATMFKSYEIDGEAFLSLSQRDLTTFLKLKFGHAVKLYNIIILLRQKFSHHAISFS